MEVTHESQLLLTCRSAQCGEGPERQLVAPNKWSQSQGSVKVSAAIPEQRAKRDVTTFDE